MAASREVMVVAVEAGKIARCAEPRERPPEEPAEEVAQGSAGGGRRDLSRELQKLA